MIDRKNVMDMTFEAIDREIESIQKIPRDQQTPAMRERLRSLQWASQKRYG